MSGAKIIEGLEDAIAGDFASVTIDGKRWICTDRYPGLAAYMVKLEEERDALLAQIERLITAAEEVCGWDTANDHPDFSRDVEALRRLLPSEHA